MFLDLACHIVFLRIVSHFTKWRDLEFILYVCKRSYLFLVLFRLSDVIHDSVCSLIFIALCEAMSSSIVCKSGQNFSPMRPEHFYINTKVTNLWHLFYQ
jgi:hypothetical protein